MTVAAIDPPPFPRRNILGVEISVARQREAIEFLLARLAARIPTRVAFANANLLTTLSSQPGGTRLLDGFLVLNDGIAVDVASLAKTAALLGERYCCTHLRGGRAAFSSRRGGAARA
jgi:UDP-N-acetyl-D-mannosaminuronic acid transferase (WecB/TagA/CpsF family)